MSVSTCFTYIRINRFHSIHPIANDHVILCLHCMKQFYLFVSKPFQDWGEKKYFNMFIPGTATKFLLLSKCFPSYSIFQLNYAARYQIFHGCIIARQKYVSISVIAIFLYHCFWRACDPYQICCTIHENQHIFVVSVRLDPHSFR